MSELFTELRGAMTIAHLVGAIRAVLILGLGLLLAKLVAGGVMRLLASRVEPQAARLVRRVVFYGMVGLFVAAALHEVGFDLTILLGAAGVLSVAVGFASQTSASNVISGLFLIGERPFAVGDIIRIGGATGEVLSIDLLSVKLRTFNNLFVRIPNESIIKSEVTNLTRFPIRRADIQVGVAYGEDLKQVREVLLGVADKNPLSLENPEPLLFINGFGTSSIDLQLSVWASRERYMELNYSIQKEIHEAFAAHGIEIPYPHLSLYAGRSTAPIPVTIEKPDDA